MNLLKIKKAQTDPCISLCTCDKDDSVCKAMHDVVNSYVQVGHAVNQVMALAIF